MTRRRTTAFLFATLISFAAASSAHAEGCSEARDSAKIVQHIFEHADTDGDGLLTQDEYERAGLQKFGVSFADSDANADGSTSMEEYRTLYERHHPTADTTGA